MSPTTKKISDMVELLSEKEKNLIYELVSRLLPDDYATSEDIDDIKQARLEYQNGETVNLYDIL